MQAYQADIAKFEAANTKVFGISMDAIIIARYFGESHDVILSDRAFFSYHFLPHAKFFKIKAHSRSPRFLVFWSSTGRLVDG